MDLKNQSAVVTGGASGMGAVTANALAARGARVAILDINQIVAYFAYVNRVADGLGVDLEDVWNKK